MIARLTKTVGTHTAAAAVVLLVLGAAGAGMTLAHAEGADAPSLAVAEAAKAKPHPTPVAGQADDAQDTTEAPETAATPGTRPTDTHGYCVSQIATSDTGDANHGEVVRAAAHACGKEAATASPSPEASAASHAREGKAVGKGHGTGKPSGVPAR